MSKGVKVYEQAKLVHLTGESAKHFRQEHLLMLIYLVVI